MHLQPVSSPPPGTAVSSGLHPWHHLCFSLPSSPVRPAPICPPSDVSMHESLRHVCMLCKESFVELQLFNSCHFKGRAHGDPSCHHAPDVTSNVYSFKRQSQNHQAFAHGRLDFIISEERNASYYELCFFDQG